MKQLFAAALLTAISTFSFAQNDANSLRESARKLMVSGDLATAISNLNKAIQIEGNNIELKKDLALAYYYDKNYKKALDVIEPVMKSDDGDVASYQLAGTIYKTMQDVKSAEKVYQEGLRLFPRVGSLYSEYGELLDIIQKPREAIAMWEKGMEVAPSYGNNYYNAAIYYYKQPYDKIYAILYGEIYSNMESMNPKTLTVKKMVLDTYKDLFSGTTLQSSINDSKNAFAKAVLQTYVKQGNNTSQALTTEALGMIRTRFILDWNNVFAKQYPFQLFDYHTMLMKEGLYEAYNQWMFGPVDNEDAFKNWAALHKEDYNRFTQYHSNRIFKMPPGQTYSGK